MSFFSKLSDRDVDAIVGGNAPAGHDELEELALFFREARNVLPEQPTAATAATHLAVVAEAARVAGSQTAGRRASVLPMQRRLRRRFALPVRLAAAAAALALVAAFGGAAYAGGLPDPVQGRVADLVSNVGISLPGHHDDVDQGDVVKVDHGNQGTPAKTSPNNHVLDPQPKPDDRPKTDDGAHAKTDDGAHANSDNGAHTRTDDGMHTQTGSGAHTKTDDHAQPKTDDHAQPQTDGGAHTTTDDGAHPDPDDGAHGNGHNG